MHFPETAKRFIEIITKGVAETTPFFLHFSLAFSPLAFRHPIGVKGRRPLEQAT